MSKNKHSKKWIQEHIHDPYVRLAKKKGYRTRAAFKLIEILDSEKLMYPGSLVVDLGAAPGSWSQVVSERLLKMQRSEESYVIALDTTPIEPIPGVDFIRGDFYENETLEHMKEKLCHRKIDLIVSDMAPNFSGVKVADASRIQHMCEAILDFSLLYLKAQGGLVIKTFHMSGFSQIVEAFKRHFRRVVERKPKASRDKSSEAFLIVQRLK